MLIGRWHHTCQCVGYSLFNWFLMKAEDQLLLHVVTLLLRLAISRTRLLTRAAKGFMCRSHSKSGDSIGESDNENKDYIPLVGCRPARVNALPVCMSVVFFSFWWEANSKRQQAPSKRQNCQNSGRWLSQRQDDSIDSKVESLDLLISTEPSCNLTC